MLVRALPVVGIERDEPTARRRQSLVLRFPSSSAVPTGSAPPRAHRGRAERPASPGVVFPTETPTIPRSFSEQSPCGRAAVNRVGQTRLPDSRGGWQNRDRGRAGVNQLTMIGFADRSGTAADRVFPQPSIFPSRGNPARFRSVRTGCGRPEARSARSLTVATTPAMSMPSPASSTRSPSGSRSSIP